MSSIQQRLAFGVLTCFWACRDLVQVSERMGLRVHGVVAP